MGGRWRFILLGFFAALVATSAVADEVIHFTNGTSLPIRSHRIEGEMISVDLGSDSRMGFPAYMVDKIESAGRSVFLNPAYHPSNQAVEGAAGAAPVAQHVVTGEGGVPSHYRNPARRERPSTPDSFVGAGSLPGADASAAATAGSSRRPLRTAGRLPAGSEAAGGEAGPGPSVGRASPRDRSGLARLSALPGATVPPPVGDEDAPPAEVPAPEEPTPPTAEDVPPSQD